MFSQHRSSCSLTFSANRPLQIWPNHLLTINYFFEKQKLRLKVSLLKKKGLSLRFLGQKPKKNLPIKKISDLHCTLRYTGTALGVRPSIAQWVCSTFHRLIIKVQWVYRYDFSSSKNQDIVFYCTIVVGWPSTEDLINSKAINYNQIYLKSI